MSKEIKLVILGHGDHGKDTVAKLIAELYDFKYVDATHIACEHMIWPLMRDIYGGHFQHCIQDRANNRELWARLIKSHLIEDPLSLAKPVFEEGDIYAGIRAKIEYVATKKEFDIVTIWVDASKRVAKEDESSTTVTQKMADYTIDNNGSEDYLREQVIAIMENET